jgi:hypothetical protein
MKHLEGNGAPVSNVLGEEDGRHAAAPELALDRIAGKTDSKLLLKFRQSTPALSKVPRRNTIAAMHHPG